jgi:mannose-1-phosphate guanylyltransferase
VTCEYPLEDLLAFHKHHGKEGTIMVRAVADVCVVGAACATHLPAGAPPLLLQVTKVAEPSKYGVVIHDAAGQIQHFVEKPQTFVGNHINAGLYCFSRGILDRIEVTHVAVVVCVCVCVCVCVEEAVQG